MLITFGRWVIPDHADLVVRYFMTKVRSILIRLKIRWVEMETGF